MDDYESLKHTRWECKYHVVFIPKCRRKKLYEQLRQQSRGGVSPSWPSSGRAKSWKGTWSWITCTC